MVICLLRTAGSDGHGLFTPFGKKNVKAAMLGATEGLVLLQAQQLATSLYTFGRGVRDGNRAPFLGFDADVVECGNRRPGGDQNRFYKLSVTALSPFRVSRAESFEVLLLREIPTCTQYLAEQNKSAIGSRNAKGQTRGTHRKPPAGSNRQCLLIRAQKRSRSA
jgi:hypothetical protein